MRHIYEVSLFFEKGAHLPSTNDGRWGLASHVLKEAQKVFKENLRGDNFEREHDQ